MSRAVSTIPVGHPGSWRTVHTEGGYAVFARMPGLGRPVDYLIGSLAEATQKDFQPASTIAPFSSEADAIEALKRWATDPLPPGPPPRVRKPGAYRRNSDRKRKEKSGAGQLELDLSR
jgi:hypothetical protein